jgi:hypothetical protein
MSNTNPSKTRPILVTWLSVGVLILAAVQLIRFLAVLRIPDLGYVVPTWYLAFRNGVWFVLMVAIGLGLSSGRRRLLNWIKLVTLLLFLWYWMDRLFLVESSIIRDNFALPALFSVVGISLFFWSLSRPKVRDFFEG